MNAAMRMVVAAAALAATACFAAEAKRSLEGKDTAGAAVKVPAEGKVSVVVFLRPGQAQSDRVREAVVTGMKDAAGVQVVGVVTGDKAGAYVKELAGKWPYPLVTDPAYEMAGGMGVKVSPTVVVVRADGTEAGHLAGAPASFAKDLDAYVAYAAGKLDEAGLQKRLAGTEVVADSADQKAARHVELAGKHVERERFAEAKAELARAGALNPVEGKVLYALARGLLAVGDVAGAQGVIEKMPAKAVSPGEMALLKGRTAAARGEWAAAAKLLEEAVKTLPEPAEAWYFLGRLYEKQGETAKAAGAYRKAFEHTATGKALGAGTQPTG